MTTLHYQGVNEIHQKLAAVQVRRWTFLMVTGIVAVITIVVASLLVVAVSAGYWAEQPPTALRWGLLAGTCLLWSAAIGWFIVRAFTWKQNHAQVARFIEQATPELRNNLINSVLLADDGDQVSPELVGQGIHEALRHARRADLMASISMKSLQRWGIAVAVGAAALVAFAMLQPRVFARGLLAVLKPTGYVSTQGNVEMVTLKPGDTTIYANESITVTAHVRNKDQRELEGKVVIDGARKPKKMGAAGGYTIFSARLGKLDQTVRYAVYIGDTRWPTDRKWYVITVLPRVVVKGIDLQYDYPPYIGWKRKIQKNCSGNINSPLGTTVRVTVGIVTPAPSAVLYVRGTSAPQRGAGPKAPRGSVDSVPMARSHDGKSFSTPRGSPIRVNANGTYRIEFHGANQKVLGRLPSLGETDAAADSVTAPGVTSGWFSIRAEDDAPPQITFLRPNKDVNLPSGQKLLLRVKVTDKYGLSGATLRLGPEEKDERTPVPGFAPPGLKGQTEMVFEHSLDLGKYPLNSVVEYFATVTDNRNLGDLKLGPQTVYSRRFRVTIQDQAEVDQKMALNFEMLRKRLLVILEMQAAELVNTEICLTKEAHKDVMGLGKTITAGQEEIRVELVDLRDNFPFGPEMNVVEQKISDLARNEAVTAHRQAEVLATLGEMANRDKACDMLRDTQKEIIETLKTLLSIMPSLERKARKKDKGGGDLPADVADKIEELKNKLEEFIDQEKKVIKASERLAKKPTDAFTADDEKVLKELEATQDKCEKFINEAISDFSKLAQQDFSNPQMLKELVAVKTDVTMAKDALKKKATEIATAAEDSGVENAKSLTANLEKWLPDEPDRIKWAMEDPAGGQDNIEAANLPTELEDLVGDLLEQEEDLFEDMDDISSKATMSGDKGIGWDAMDGPISNMNAQGVTGNQLPNTNEMSGRSGEGRSGKSTGEFVEDKAVGKGGRRTPTRLTPEPFQKGQVNDTSTEPPGGSTGGGKISGAGAEGLEGPVPPPLAKEMQRLAKKQASLLNSAERIRTGFKVSDLSHFKLLQAMSLMDRVYNDLRNYRYQNVLRARHATIAALRDASNMKAGEIDISIDTSAGMPKYIRDNIADAMKGKLPEEYREVLEQYYRRLGDVDIPAAPK